MHVALVVLLCASFNHPHSCVKEVITDDTISPTLSISTCLYGGQQAAVQFVQEHPLYHTWHLQGWSCQMGRLPQRKSA